jgi:hypothetical protein
LSNLTLSEINIYPVKSCGAITLSSSCVGSLGLKADRRFVITDQQGLFISGRTYPKLTLIKVQYTNQSLVISAPNMPNLILNNADFSPHYKKIKVWDDIIEGQYCGNKYDQWLSQFLATPCQLIYFGEHSHRLVKNRQEQLAFADGYPLLLISQASLDDLNNKLIQQQLSPVSMSQFRSNLVISHGKAFQEDSWHRIRIGDVIFEIVKPCSRCIFTTVNPKTGKKNTAMQPLKTLRQYRHSTDNKGIMFGQNLVALNSGNISINDNVEVLATKAAAIYANNFS